MGVKKTRLTGPKATSPGLRHATDECTRWPFGFPLVLDPLPFGSKKESTMNPSGKELDPASREINYTKNQTICQSRRPPFLELNP